MPLSPELKAKLELLAKQRDQEAKEKRVAVAEEREAPAEVSVEKAEPLTPASPGLAAPTDKVKAPLNPPDPSASEPGAIKLVKGKEVMVKIKVTEDLEVSVEIVQ